MNMKKFLTIPFTLECIVLPDAVSVSYVIVRDPQGLVSAIVPNLDGAFTNIQDVLDEFVFSKNTKDEKS